MVFKQHFCNVVRDHLVHSEPAERRFSEYKTLSIEESFIRRALGGDCTAWSFEFQALMIFLLFS